MNSVHVDGLPRRRASAFSRQLQALVGFLVLVALVSANPLLSIASLVAFGLIWFGAMNNPIKVIVAAYLSFQWLQVSMAILIANAIGVDLAVVQSIPIGNAYFHIVEGTQAAILLGLACLVVHTFAFRFLAPRLANFRPDLRNYIPSKLLTVYLCLLVASLSIGPFTAGGLSQPLIVLGWLRFVPAVLLFVRWLTLRDATPELAIVCAVEIVTGFLGYFSGFRNIFFIMGAATLALHYALEQRAIKILSVAAVVALLLGSFWTVIKPTYRDSLNLGTGSQAVLISVEERLDRLTNLVSDVSLSNMQDGFGGLLVRIAYVQYLADVMRNVPRLIPHEYGALWRGAVSNTLMPRILFPEKAILGSDSARTMRYTGRRLAGSSEGTSISMGYVAEGYVDYGIFGALFASLCLGVLCAVIARTIVRLNRDPDFTSVIAVLVILFFPIQEFGTSNAKLLGGIVWRWIICAIFVGLLWPRLRDFCVRRRIPQGGRASRAARRARTQSQLSSKDLDG